jgi:DNA-binding CsgD family transcriptional regulator
MDWSAVAYSIAEQAGLPALLLGGRGDLLLVAPAAERALGLGFDNVGRDWIERYVAPHAVPSARWHLDKALSGALRKLELTLRSAQGLTLARFDAHPIGRDDEAGLLLVLERLLPIAREETPADYDYEVGAIATGGFGLKQLLRLGAETENPQGACFQVLHGRSEPCEGCPLANREAGARSGTLVRPRPPHEYVITVVSAQADGDEARVSVRTLGMSSLAAVLQAKLDELASRASLSKRERSVFGYLMDGRAVEEIANELQISPRTVKFHQANLLQKLGADSRTDLMRLVF